MMIRVRIQMADIRYTVRPCCTRIALDSLKEEVNNYVDQLNDGNNLFMTKFKNVVNTMNEALDGANSMADKSHDTVKNLVSRW